MVIKKIYMYWGQGFDQAPWIVQKCLASWQHYNSEWQIIQLSENNIQDYIELPVRKGRSWAAWSDLIRISILAKHGGVWCDATLFCLKPLDNWLTNIAESGFWAFKAPTKDRLVASWFLYGEPSNYLIKRWYQSVLWYWDNPKNWDILRGRQRTRRNIKLRYYWFHHLFGKLCHRDKQFAEFWSQIKTRESGSCHFMLKRFLKRIDKTIEERIDKPKVPLVKLSHKFKCQKLHAKAGVNYLIQRQKNYFLPKSL